MRLCHALAFVCLVAACDSPSSGGGSTTSPDSSSSDTPQPGAPGQPAEPANPGGSTDPGSSDPSNPDPGSSDPDPGNPDPGDPDPGNSDPGPGPGTGQCEGDWTLGSTFYTGDDLGTACEPHNAPQNCVSGDFIMFGDGTCVCIAACSAFVDIGEGDKCASSASGDWSCQRIRATNASANGGLYCVPEFWGLCTESDSTPGGDPGSSDPGGEDPGSDPSGEDPGSDPECFGSGEDCSFDSDCCSGYCDFEAGTCN